jgi:folate-binding Fe-S cluster repair protein YgfZ
LRGLTPPHGLPSVLASPVGRFIALLFAYAEPEAVSLRVEAGQADALVRYFGSMIFWQDDVQVTDLTAETGHRAVWGHCHLPARD